MLCSGNARHSISIEVNGGHDVKIFLLHVTKVDNLFLVHLLIESLSANAQGLGNVSS